jgi:ADP-ribosylation factor-like protein 8
MTSLFKTVAEWLDWLWSFFYHQEMELTLVGLGESGKTTLVNVIAVSKYIISLEIIVS